jgi:hypothetical protein
MCVDDIILNEMFDWNKVVHTELQIVIRSSVCLGMSVSEERRSVSETRRTAGAAVAGDVTTVILKWSVVVHSWSSVHLSASFATLYLGRPDVPATVSHSFQSFPCCAMRCGSLLACDGCGELRRGLVRWIDRYACVMNSRRGQTVEWSHCLRRQCAAVAVVAVCVSLCVSRYDCEWLVPVVTYYTTRFIIKNPYVLPTECVCSTISGYFRAQLNVLITQARFVYCAVRTGPLNIIRFNPGIYRVNKQERAFLSGVRVKLRY